MTNPTTGQGFGDTGSGGGVSPGGGGGSAGATGMATVLTLSITLKTSGVIDVDGAALQSFAPGTSGWRFELWIDGQMVWAPSGTAPGDVVAIGGCLYCAVDPTANPNGRQVTVLLKWAATNAITLGARYLKARGFNNVSG